MSLFSLELTTWNISEVGGARATSLVKQVGVNCDGPHPGKLGAILKVPETQMELWSARSEAMVKITFQGSFTNKDTKLMIKHYMSKCC